MKKYLMLFLIVALFAEVRANAEGGALPPGCSDTPGVVCLITKIHGTNSISYSDLDSYDFISDFNLSVGGEYNNLKLRSTNGTTCQIITADGKAMQDLRDQLAKPKLTSVTCDMTSSYATVLAGSVVGRLYLNLNNSGQVTFSFKM